MPKTISTPSTLMNRCASGHAIVLASWEKNSLAWLDGHYFELRSRKPRLQETVGDGGTLWIVVSRPTRKGRLYTVSLRLKNCRRHTYRHAGKFGRYAVIGDSSSQFLATADDRLLVLALRFDPHRPIKGPADNQVSNSIRVPRCLSLPDVRLLKKNVARSDRWSTFLSYQRSGDLKAARELSDALQLQGFSVFRDVESLRGGVKWWETVQRAITRSQQLVVLIGPTTHQSKWVLREVQHALDHNIRVVPVKAGGTLRSWDSFGTELSDRNALDLSTGLDAVLAGLK